MKMNLFNNIWNDEFIYTLIYIYNEFIYILIYIYNGFKIN